MSEILQWEDGYNLVELPRGHQQFKYVTDKMRKTLQQHNNGIQLGSYTFNKVYKVKNSMIWEEYTKRRAEIIRDIGGHAEEKRLFHGSPHAMKITQSGFDLSRAKASGMYGGGLYFAGHSSKSNQYAYGLGQGCDRHNDRGCCLCPRYMLLCRVTLGNKQKLTDSDRSGKLPSGYHSIHGVPSNNGLQYPEYIVYHSYQAYPGFLVEYTINKSGDTRDGIMINTQNSTPQLSGWGYVFILLLILVVCYLFMRVYNAVLGFF